MNIEDVGPQVGIGSKVQARIVSQGQVDINLDMRLINYGLIKILFRIFCHSETVIIKVKMRQKEA